jgi:hypothetical protein
MYLFGIASGPAGIVGVTLRFCTPEAGGEAECCTVDGSGLGFCDSAMGLFSMDKKIRMAVDLTHIFTDIFSSPGKHQE